MPTFEVQVDGVVVARPSDAAMVTLSASVLVTRDNGASLGVHGAIRIGNTKSLVDWVSRPIPAGCTVQVTYISNECDNAPDPTPSQLQTEIEKHKADAKAIIKGLKESMGLPDGPLLRDPRELPPSSAGLVVSVYPAKPISALLASEEMVQAVLTWSRRECKVAVDSISILPGGNTKGTAYLACILEPGQQLTVKSFN